MRPDESPEARPRRRHRTDWMALLCGLLFIGVGIRFLTPPEPNPLIMGPIVVVGLGLAGFIGILVKALRGRR